MTSGSRCENISCMLWMISSRLWDSNWPLLDCTDPKLLYDESARVTKDPFAPCARLSEPLPYSAACIGAREGLSPFFFFFGILLCPFYKTPTTNPLFTSFSRGRKVKENQTNNSQRRRKNTAAPPVDGNSITPTFDLLRGKTTWKNLRYTAKYAYTSIEYWVFSDASV